VAGARRAIASEVPVDLPALCGEPPLRFRRMDRYGALGYVAAHRALAAAAERGAVRCPAASAGAAPAGAAPTGAAIGVATGTGAAAEGAVADPRWGVMIGSSLACAGSIARHDRDLRDRPLPALSAAVFVRTVANAVNGDISIGWRLGGPSETFVSGRTAGAEALAAAGAALVEGRAEWILAGAVEAPDPLLAQAPPLSEGAAITVMGMGAGMGARAREREALCLRAWMRGHDPAEGFSVAAALDALGPVPIGMVIVANTIPAALVRRIEDEADGRRVVHLPRVTGELGAAGAAVAVALADELMREKAGSAARRDHAAAPPGVLVIARDPRGPTAALALSP
jgi:3-oxoacyl-[acyl-carrier-protein] synthase II